MTVSETAERLRVSEKTVRRLASRNDLPTLRVGGSVRVDADELERWLVGQQISTTGLGSLAAGEPALGHGSFVDASAERDGTSNSEAVEPARLAGDER
jgi:excisionase family DNA binding protein